MLIDAQYLLNLSRSYCRRYLLDTSRSIKILFSIDAQYLLDLSSYVFYIYIYIYISLRSDLVFLKLKYLDLFLFSLDSNPFFSPETLSHQSQSFGMCSKSSLCSCISCVLDLGFLLWEIFGVFEFL